MEEKDFVLIAGELLERLTKDTSDNKFIFVTLSTILALLLEKGVITEEEFTSSSEVWKGYLENFK